MNPCMDEIAWNHLLPQVQEMIGEKFAYGYEPNDLIESLKKYSWTEEEPFRRERFNFEHARFTLTQLCNIVELLTGSDTDFAEQLRQRMISAVGYAANVSVIEGQELLHEEHNQAIREAV